MKRNAVFDSSGRLLAKWPGLSTRSPRHNETNADQVKRQAGFRAIRLHVVFCT